MVVKTKEAPQIDVRAEALAVAEEQLMADWNTALATLQALSKAITEKKKNATARAMAELVWLDHRITQTEMMNTALWCVGCAEEGKEMPPGPYMVFECLEHADEQLARSARSWERTLFGSLL